MDIGRFSRQTALPPIGEDGQRRLAAGTVAVVGAGGLGSPVITYLASAGVGRLVIIDGDVVSESNLNRQFLYSERDIGAAKATLAAKKAQELYPDLEVSALAKTLDGENAASLLAGCDVIVDCVDGNEARQAVGRAALKHDIPLVEGGVDGFCGFVMTVKRGFPCFGCLNKSAKPDSETPTLGATAGAAGAIMACEAVKLLTRAGEPLLARMLVFDLLTNEFETIKLVRDEACELCNSF